MKMYSMRSDSIKLDILKILLWKDMTNRQIRTAYQKKFNAEIKSSDVYIYLKRLKKDDLVRVRGKKKGKSIYRSKLREDYLAFNKLIDVLMKAEIPNETKHSVYKLVLKLLPNDLAKLMKKFTNQQQGYELREEIKEEIKGLYS